MSPLLPLLALSALAALTSAQVTSGALSLADSAPSAPSKPALLTLEQQQDLLEQLAQLQRQTQQLLAAQQSLAAVAAAAGVNGPPLASQPQSGPPHLHLQPVPRQPPQSPSGHQLHQLSAPLPLQPLQPTRPSPLKPAKPTVTSVVDDPSSLTAQQTPPPLPSGPAINWGKCPELEPSEQEKLAKASVITKCLENTPLPGNITRESVETHREQIAACALRAEGWFTAAGGYDFNKAEREIKNKRLQKELESQVLSYHAQCKSESEEKYPAASSSIIAQIQLYQACMDYFISDVCGIEVNDGE